MSSGGSSPVRTARRRLRRRVFLGVIVLTVIAAIALLVAAASTEGDRDPAVAGVPRYTTRVVRDSLVETEQVSGALSYGVATPVVNRLSGTVTHTVDVGVVTDRGTVLYSVDTKPVVVLFGDLPAYRRLETGAVGADVAQLEENLALLGYGGFVVDATYTNATAAAVRQWQHDLGTDETGVLEFGSIYFLPHTVRVASVDIEKGAPVNRGESVVSYTGVERLVIAVIDADQVALTAPDAVVRVSIGSGVEIDGRVLHVTAAQASTTAPTGQRPQPAAEHRYEVVIAIDGPAAVGARDDEAVAITLLGRRRDNVLAVPVTALLALREGGYGVELVEGAATRVVSVTTGLFARSMVEVTSDQLQEGSTVVTAAP